MDGWIGRPRLEAAAWNALQLAEGKLNLEFGESALRLLGFFILAAVELLDAVESPEWTGDALRRLAAQAEAGREEGFVL